MAETIWKYPEQTTDNLTSIKDNNDSAFSNSTEDTNNKINDIVNSAQKWKAVGILNILDSQWEQISKENEKLYIRILEKKDIKFLNELSNKSKDEIKQFLIQAQIDDLEKSDDPDYDKLDELQKDLIAVEDKKQAQQDKVIAVENKKQKEQEITITAHKETREAYSKIQNTLSSIEVSLEVLKGKSWLNAKTQSILDFLKKIKNKEISPEDFIQLTEDERNNKVSEIESDKNELLEQLKTPWTLESIAKDLGWINSEAYWKFKESAIAFDESLRGVFDGVEMDSLWGRVKMKLWTDNLNGTKLKDGVLSKTEDGVTTSFSDEEGRYLNSDWNDFKLKSELNSDNEDKLREVNTQANEILAPINDGLNLVSWILDFIQKAKDTWADLDETKEQIKFENPDLYSELWLESKNSFDDMLLVLNTKKQELEKEKEDIMKKAKVRINQLLEKNTKEAHEKDKVKKQMIKFFDSIGLTKLNQTEFNKVVSQVNINPWSYGLDWPIDLENWDIGFNKDFGDTEISSQEKLAFVEFFNKMLWEDIVRIDEKNQKIIPLDSYDINNLQKVANKKSGFFMENFNKEKK